MEVYKKINNVTCRLLTWGDPFSCGGSDVIICLTGNPGIVDFYFEFASKLHETTGLPLCLVGQSGHDIIPDEKHLILQGQEHLFDLDGQIKHKLDLVNSHIDKQSKLHFVGHSIGAWLIVESLQKDSSVMNRVASANLLFPTLQGIPDTKNAAKYLKILKHKNALNIFLIFLNILPKCFLRCLAYMYLKFNGLPSQHSDRVLKFVDQHIIEKVIFLAETEYKQVLTLNTVMLEKIKHLTNVIYGEIDDWVPLHFMEDLKQFVPPLEMTMVKYPHEFVMKHSEQVAVMVSDYIMKKKNWKYIE